MSFFVQCQIKELRAELAAYALVSHSSATPKSPLASHTLGVQSALFETTFASGDAGGLNENEENFFPPIPSSDKETSGAVARAYPSVVHRTRVKTGGGGGGGRGFVGLRV